MTSDGRAPSATWNEGEPVAGDAPSSPAVSAPALFSAAAAALGAGFALPFDIEAVQALAPWALVVVDPSALIVGASARARALLDAGGGIEERGGRLHIERAALNRRLRDRIASVLGLGSPAPSRPAGRSSAPGQDLLGAPDRRGRTRFVVKVAALPCANAVPMATVAISDLHDQGRVDRKEVAGLFGLSEREAELAEHFSHGLRIDEIAEAMGVSTNTIRVHLRHVFAKTGCSSQVELARLFVLLP